MKLSLLDVVFLNVDLPAVGLTKGQIGAVIDVYHSPSLAYEVEFVMKKERLSYLWLYHRSN